MWLLPQTGVLTLGVGGDDIRVARACDAPGFTEVIKSSSEVFNSRIPHEAWMDQYLCQVLPESGWLCAPSP